ncbi:MAG: phosphoenolpyruvate carboxylase [Paracoccaceae bacterium]|jgi:phosphoenolpyruvate carboxylase|nr:phosphoenolpyruvate carboxylase [Paracoccaceae bacterium]
MGEPDLHEKADETLGLLMRAFAEVLDTLGEGAVADALPWPDLHGRGPSGGGGRALDHADLQAYSVALQLIGAAEENAIAQARRSVEKAGRLEGDSGSWDQHFARLGAAGHDGAAIAAALPRLRVEPVLTAHPTEAKRRTVLDHHRALYRLLVEMENTMWTGAERAALEAEARAVLERLWRTGEIYLEKPTIADERANVVHYLTAVFPHVLPWVERRLAAAWSRAGFDPALRGGRAARPRLTFGDWVGGDRDGHPLVDAETTRETLALFRAEALRLQRAALDTLGARLSLSARRQPPPAGLAEWITARAEALGAAGAAALARNPDEPFRQAVGLIAAALPPETGPCPVACHATGAAYAADLRRLRGWLVEAGAERLAAADLDPVLDRAECFGLHLAALDIRQNSGFHDRALAQLLVAAGEAEGARFPDWPEERRAALIARELHRARPFAPPGAHVGAEADAMLDLYRTLTDHVAQHGTEGLGALIVSMTRSAADLFACYLLARETGLMRRDEDGPWLLLPVVPLLETIDDLERCEEVIDAYLAEPVARRSLARQAEAAGEPEPVLQVMIGYSDSGKDGGFAASFWALYRAQSRLVALGRRHGMRIRFFHGRGGAIGRGAGPTHRFLAALPPGALGGDLRMTEQGETVAQKYANRVTAAHHLELLLAGALGATLDRRDDPPELLAAMDILAEESFAAWRELVEAEGFLDFFAAATPIDLIEESRHGSRPARRTGRRTLADLRAIPWVFAWNQARFLLPGWYGLGTALERLQARAPDLFAALVAAKAEATRWPPVHFLASNAATAWARASTDRMADYAALVPDRGVAERFLGVVQAEHARTGGALAEVYGAPVAEARPAIQRRLERRDAALAPLHARQIALLADWRARRAGGDAAGADALLPELLLSVNAIASGLGATG